MSNKLLELSSMAHDLGRTHDVLGCVPVTQIVCRCTAKVPLLMVGCPSQAACPSCGRAFLLTAVTCDGVMVGTKIDAREKSLGLEIVQ